VDSTKPRVKASGASGGALGHAAVAGPRPIRYGPGP
jgi:hypothetical protein